MVLTAMNTLVMQSKTHIKKRLHFRRSIAVEHGIDSQ